MVIPEPLVPARVLLVDDGPQQLELRAHVMKMCGLSIITACGPIEAISILEDTMEKIDVAILDYHMSVMNGCALADRLRSTYPDLKIILDFGAIDIPQSEMTNVDAFIPKDDGIAAWLLAQIVQFAQVGTGPPTTVA